jgi:hypothetical protein
MVDIETILRDVRYTLRGLQRQPGTTALALGALAIGIAVNATVFTARQAIFDRPLDARRPNEMVNVAIRDRSDRWNMRSRSMYRPICASSRGQLSALTIRRSSGAATRAPVRCRCQA